MSRRKYKLPRYYTRLGSELLLARVDADLTQREVSDFLGYSSAQFISNFERGISAPPLKKLKRLCARYRMPTSKAVHALLEGERRKILEALGS